MCEQRESCAYNDPALNSQVRVLMQPDFDSRFGLEELEDQKLYEMRSLER